MEKNRVKFGLNNIVHYQSIVNQFEYWLVLILLLVIEEVIILIIISSLSLIWGPIPLQAEIQKATQEELIQTNPYATTLIQSSRQVFFCFTRGRTYTHKTKQTTYTRSSCLFGSPHVSETPLLRQHTYRLYCAFSVHSSTWHVEE